MDSEPPFFEPSKKRSHLPDPTRKSDARRTSRAALQNGSCNASKPEVGPCIINLSDPTITKSDPRPPFSIAQFFGLVFSLSNLGGEREREREQIKTQREQIKAEREREREKGKKLFTLLDLCVSSLRRGHANLLCIVPILTDDPRRESKGRFETHVLPSPRQGGCGVPCRGILKTVGRHVALFREAHLTTHHRLHGAAML